MQLILKDWHDPALFRSHVESFLGEREAENNLVFGILAGVIDGRQKFSDEPPLLASVEAETGVQLVGLRTPPLNVVLSTARSEEAVALLARELWAAGHRLPGVTAPSREAKIFAEAWSQISGAPIRQEHSQRIYLLDRVNPPRPTAGHLHLCDERDLVLATEWMRAFNRDVGEHQVPGDPRRFIGQREAGLFFWIDDRPVSMAGFSGPTPNGIRIGAVYTPPELRGRGFASACVAAVSQRLLNEGRKFCFLYTDLANPTSNHIYQEIGYRPVCDASVLAFE
ncbi:MAG TPA: GNAT family N-acetyltransferase [Candidatus Binataceae bacterium]